MESGKRKKRETSTRHLLNRCIRNWEITNRIENESLTGKSTERGTATATLTSRTARAERGGTTTATTTEHQHQHHDCQWRQ